MRRLLQFHKQQCWPSDRPLIWQTPASFALSLNWPSSDDDLDGEITLEDTMAKTDFKSVDEYLASQSEFVQGVLECVRNSIRRAVPAVEEVISYKIPTYKLQGRPVLHFAGWRKHYSLYPAS